MRKRRWDAGLKNWVAWTCMVVGWVVGGYSFLVIVRYVVVGHVHPLLFGEDAMSFSTACTIVFIGVALFWVGFLLREESIVRSYESGRLTSAQKVQIILAVMSSITLILTTLFAALRDGK